jgi:alpha-tubulin suppressor-like RCC1 family protein
MGSRDNADVRALVWLALVGCGRIGFDALRDGSAPSDAPSDATPARFSSLRAYANQTCAVYAGRPYCWGANASGQLGTTSTANAPVPTPVAVPAGTVVDLTEGDSDGCVIVDATLYCYGALAGTSTPTAVPSVTSATAVGAGNGFACAIGDRVYCWGNASAAGQLGRGNPAPSATPVPVVYPGTPNPQTQLSVGDDHACSLALGQPPWCWGHNDFGTLGFGSMNPTSELAPINVVGGVQALPHIAGWHACSLEGNRVYCWGEGDRGELGDNMSTSSAMPMMISTPGLVMDVATGGGPADGDASCAISATADTIECWGNGQFGRLGNGMAMSTTGPVPVQGLPSPTNAVHVALGYDHTCALLADGDIWCWGKGDSGQLGDGRSTSSLVPVRVQPPF